MGASGITKFEPISELLTVCFGDNRGEHSYLLSGVCPVNLLGRDLICALNTEMHCDPTDIKIKYLTAGLYPVGSYESDYYYTWDTVKPGNADKLLLTVLKFMAANS